MTPIRRASSAPGPAMSAARARTRRASTAGCRSRSTHSGNTRSMSEDNEYLGGRSEEQDEAAADTEPNPAGGMPEHEQAEEPGPPVAGDAGGESARTPSAGL